MSRLIIALLAVAPLAGCAPSNLYVAHHTVIGINATVDANQTSGHLVVGYDRHFAAIVPTDVDVSGDGASHKEAMSALNCSRLEVDGIFLARFTESLATGDAALAFARSAAGRGKASKFFSCLRGPAEQAP